MSAPVFSLTVKDQRTFDVPNAFIDRPANRSIFEALTDSLGGKDKAEALGIHQHGFLHRDEWDIPIVMVKQTPSGPVAQLPAAVGDAMVHGVVNDSVGGAKFWKDENGVVNWTSPEVKNAQFRGDFPAEMNPGNPYHSGG